MDPLVLCERAEHERITVTHLLLTHHHDDHVEGGVSQKEQLTVDPFEEAPILEQMLQGQLQEVRHRFAIERHLHPRTETHES